MGDHSLDHLPPDPLADAEEAIIDMATLGRDLARRKAERGLPDLPRNAGANRTPSKHAMLQAIKDAGGSGDWA